MVVSQNLPHVKYAGTKADLQDLATFQLYVVHHRGAHQPLASPRCHRRIQPLREDGQRPGKHHLSQRSRVSTRETAYKQPHKPQNPAVYQLFINPCAPMCPYMETELSSTPQTLANLRRACLLCCARPPSPPPLLSSLDKAEGSLVAAATLFPMEIELYKECNQNCPSARPHYVLWTV